MNGVGLKAEQRKDRLCPLGETGQGEGRENEIDVLGKFHTKFNESITYEI